MQMAGTSHVPGDGGHQVDEGTYFAMLATPLRVMDVLLGHLGWIALRLDLVSTIYLGVDGRVRDPPLARTPSSPSPPAVLTGMAFAAPISAFSAMQVNDVGFSAIYRFGMIPLFLFSGRSSPSPSWPGWLQIVA